MSSTIATPSSTSSTDPAATSSSNSIIPSGGGGVSSSLYLYTFLITILVLGLISAVLLFRAYYIRRRLQRRVEEAIRLGQPLPQDAAAALGLTRPTKKVKQVGPMPITWEAEMWRDEGAGLLKEDGISSKDWEGITPLSITHFPPPAPPVPLSIISPPTRTWRDRLTHPFRARPPQFTPAVYSAYPQLRPPLNRQLTIQSVRQVKPALTPLEAGEECVVGVLIAMPSEVDERWERDEEEEAEVPGVVLGVMGCTVRGE